MSAQAPCLRRRARHGRILPSVISSPYTTFLGVSQGIAKKLHGTIEEVRRRPRRLRAAAPSSGFPRSVRRTIRAGKDHAVAVGIAEPDLPVIRAAVVVRRVAVTGEDDF